MCTHLFLVFKIFFSHYHLLSIREFSKKKAGNRKLKGDPWTMKVEFQSSSNTQKKKANKACIFLKVPMHSVTFNYFLKKIGIFLLLIFKL